MKKISLARIMRMVICIGLSVGIGFQGFSQSSPPRLSASVALGLPVTLFTIPSQPIGIFTGAARYSFTKNLSAEFKLTAATFFNNATGHPSKPVLDKTVTDIMTYRTPVYGFNGIVYYNFHNLPFLKTGPDSRWLPFLLAGAGINLYKPGGMYANGVKFQNTEFGKPFRDYQFGFGTRFYINNNLDLYGGWEYHISETYYLDAFPEPTNPSLDQYMNFFGGVSVKFGAQNWNNLIDWSHRNVENPNESPKVYSRWAFDLTLGTPILFTPISTNITGMVGFGGRYTFTNSLGLQLNYAFGKVSGSQAGSATATPGQPDYVTEFSTSLGHITARAFINVLNLQREPSARRNFNHYLILGAGLVTAKGDATFVNGLTVKDVRPYPVTSSGIQNIVIGYEARKYFNHQLDFIAGADFAYNQSKWIDQAGVKPTLNSHLYLHAGVTYKIGTSKEREHMDWAYQSYNNFKDKKVTLDQVPVIEKPVEQPKPVTVEPIKEIEKPKEEPKPVVEPTPVVEPKPVPVPEPVKVQPVVPPVEAVKPIPVPEAIIEKPVEQVKPIAAEPKPVQKPKAEKAAKPIVLPRPESKAVVTSSEVTPPPSRYNVIVACYSVNKLNVAKAYQNELAMKGYSPSIYRSSTNSRMLRLAVISTDDRNESIRTLRKSRKEIEPQSWIHLYNKQ